MGIADNLTEPAADQRPRSASASVQQLLGEGSALLGALTDSARLEAELLLSHVLDRPRSALLAHGEQRVEPGSKSRYRVLLARRAAGEPLAYLTGEREFWSLRLAVGPAVLIPRPESEHLVERTLALLPERSQSGQIRVADLGTGSGAIALALCCARPLWKLTATDLSAAALQLARRNAAQLKLERVEFLQGDWFAPLDGRRFHAIVSNPPYVAASEAAMRSLRFEPAAALTPGPSGLEALHHLIARAPPFLEPGAWLVLEHGAQQAREVAAALVAAGYARVRCHRDLCGHDRVTEAQWEG